MYRFVKLEDQKRTLVSRLLQYTLVHEVLQIPFGDIIIKRTLEGKPFLVPTSLLLCFSIVILSMSNSPLI